MSQQPQQYGQSPYGQQQYGGQPPYGQEPYGRPQPQPEPPRRGWFARHKVLTAIGAVVVVVAIGGALGAGGSDGSDSSKDSASASAGAGSDGKGGKDKAADDAKKAEEPEVAIEGDGDFEVGSDVKPGTYRTTGNDDGMCYWERLKDSKGELESILANDNVTGTSYVTVKAGDKLFKSSGCNGWTAFDESAKGSPKGGDIKGDGGMFKVGVDIAPGTYKSTGNTDDMCYWERAKDAEHGIDSIAANDNVKGTGIVTITAKDAYFKTSGCQDWKKTG
ncbi:hypothetical protein [Streptomyces indicus]|uniref:Uncharacterized protein n=1 Tax=Streptomyces indicus TaxID=417292 RepID=A0A1G9GUU3_9ACTN|nr:hypothetical protein [Streptomyces indicus]SDL04446.1 hypothetical protein SAMN05421806_11728 [Streptomyces indicus]